MILRCQKPLQPIVDATMGYDQTFVVDAVHQKAAATVYAPQSGICMELFTNQPAIQFYSGHTFGSI
jgi:aldose 1-epimerase